MEIEINDADLVERIGSGDRDSESTFCRRMAPRVRLYGLRHLRDSAAADDLAQQVMITALEALRGGRLREPAKLASFVLGICRVTVLDQFRNTRRKQRLFEQFTGELSAAFSPS